MLTVWEAIKTRRSIRKFRADEVSDEIIEQLLEAARLAPSGGNRQPWRFMVVRDKQAKKELRRICLDQRFVEEAPVVFICFGDFDRYSVDARSKRNQEFTDFGVLETLSGKFADPKFREELYSRPVQSKAELFMPVAANAYIAIEHIVLMATALGLGSCWIGGFGDAREINQLFNLPHNLVPLIVLPVGYPDGKVPPQRPRLSRDEILLKPPPKVLTL